jgi:hypothetical protein
VDAESQRFLIPDYIPKPKPGSVVYVPVNEGGGTSILTTLGSLTGVASSLLAVIALLRTH